VARRPAVRAALGAVGAVGAVLVLGVLAGCGSGTHSSAPPASTSTPTVSSSGSPGDIPTVSSPRPSASQGTPRPGQNPRPRPSDELGAFRQRCLRETTSLDAASVFYTSPVRLAKARPHRFILEIRPAARSGDRSPGGLQRHGRILLACTVQARLLDVPDTLQVAPSTWQGRRFLPPDPARWTWVVTARTEGRTDTVLQLKPVVQIDDGHRIAVQDLGVAEYDVTFSASAATAPAVPFTHRVGDFLASSWQVLVGLATGVSAILAALVALRGLRVRRSADADGGSAGAPERKRTVSSGGPPDGEDHRDS
jgi:hypothetical protein